MYCFAADFTGQAINARRDVDRERRHRGRTHGDRDRRRRAGQRAAESRSVHRIHEEVGACEGTFERDEIEHLVDREVVDPDAPMPQHARRDTTIGSVVALAARHHDAPPVRPSQLLPGRDRDRAPGSLDEDRLGRSARDGAPIGFGHLGRREYREHTTIVGDRSGARVPRRGTISAAPPEAPKR